MLTRILVGTLTIFISAPFIVANPLPRQENAVKRFTCDSAIEDEVRSIKKHPEKLKELILSLKEVAVSIVYCNGMGNDDVWPSFTSRVLNDGGIDWVVRMQVIEKVLNTKFNSNWLGSPQVDASEEPLLESRKNALTRKDGKCQAYYSWRTQGIYFLPPIETQVEIVKKVRELAKKKHMQ